MAYDLGQIDPEERTGIYADPREMEDEPRPSGLLRIAGALLVMGVFAGGLWLAYDLGARRAGAAGGGDIPLVRADRLPMKVKPANPGGMQVPNRDMLIYGGQRPQVEHLLPPPEQPMARPTAQILAAEPAPGLPTQIAAATPPIAAGSPTGDPAVTPGTSAAPAPVSAPPATAAASPAKPAAAHVAAAKPGSLRLQLGSVRSEGAARGEWERLKRDNPDLLGHMSAVAIRADLGDKGVYYRIQAGPVADATTAGRICGELRQRRLACIIVR